MGDLINIAVLIGVLFGGTSAADKIFLSVRQAALTKAAHGLPRLSPFAAALTSEPNSRRTGHGQEVKVMLTYENYHKSASW